MAASDGEIVYTQPSDWVTVTCCPAITTAPDRGGPLVGLASKVTRPWPRPLAPDLMLIQSVSLRAVHSQSALLAVTSTSRPPPAEGTLAAVAERSYRHAAGACWMFSLLSLTRTAPLRAIGSSVLLTENASVAAPCPSVVPERLIHGTSADAVQRHSRSVEIDNCAFPPSGPKEVVLAVAATEHLVEVGEVTPCDVDPQAAKTSMLPPSVTRETVAMGRSVRLMIANYCRAVVAPRTINKIRTRSENAGASGRE
jgi:hypothetical protein